MSGGSDGFPILWPTSSAPRDRGAELRVQRINPVDLGPHRRFLEELSGRADPLTAPLAAADLETAVWR